MFLWFSVIYVGSGTLGTLLDGFLWCFVPTLRSGLAGPYILSYLEESSIFSAQLCIIPSCKQVLNFDVTSQ